MMFSKILAGVMMTAAVAERGLLEEERAILKPTEMDAPEPVAAIQMESAPSAKGSGAKLVPSMGFNKLVGGDGKQEAAKKTCSLGCKICEFGLWPFNLLFGMDKAACGFFCGSPEKGCGKPTCGCQGCGKNCLCDTDGGIGTMGCFSSTGDKDGACVQCCNGKKGD